MGTLFVLCCVAWMTIGCVVVTKHDMKLTGMSWSDYLKEGSAEKSFLMRKTNMLVFLAVLWPIVPIIFRKD